MPMAVLDEMHATAPAAVIEHLLRRDVVEAHPGIQPAGVRHEGHLAGPAVVDEQRGDIEPHRDGDVVDAGGLETRGRQQRLQVLAESS